MERIAFLCAYLAVVSAGTTAAPADSDPVVALDTGIVRGQTGTVRGSETLVRQYLGIPFARPPTGELRFAAPQPPDAWEGERACTQMPPMCMQDPAVISLISKLLSIEFTLTSTSEDCLYLNVYTPARPSTGEKLPVMVWIHGGAFRNGAAVQYDGTALAAYQNVVVVIIQYRLGVFGFWSTGDEQARGNWGLLDQIQALRWVQRNIQSFGGDPGSVTVFGESAGGISASMLILSPLATGLFQRAILQSGVATLGSYSTRDPLRMARVVANQTGCDQTSSEHLLRCMRGVDSEELMNNTKKVMFLTAAAVDGVFLKDLPEEVLRSKDFLKVPVLLGVTNQEFGWLIPKAVLRPGWEEGMHRPTVIAFMNKLFPSAQPDGNEVIAAEYLQGTLTPAEVRDGFIEMASDLFMVLPVIKVARYHRDAGVPVFLYEFQHRPQMHNQTRPSFVKADHADEIGFVFGACFWNGHIKVKGAHSNEDKLCKTMMAYWANFARTGSPNVGNSRLVDWPLFDHMERYLNLDLEPTVGQNLRQNRMHLLAKAPTLRQSRSPRRAPF